MRKILLFAGIIPYLGIAQFAPCIVQDKFDPARIQHEKNVQEELARTPHQRATILTIPIVFHVVYNAGIENISDAQILAQLDYTSKDFRRLNSDTINTPSAFASVAADSEIEFCLATQDPSGNFTTGITRTYTDSLTFVAGPGSADNMKFTATGGEDAWDTDQYLNIWIVNLSMASGFASSPMSHGMPKDGIVMNYTNINNTHLMSHEIGHYLDLMHIYGMEGSMCEAMDGGDMVSDTPDQYTSTFGCPTFPQTDACTTVSPGIMFMNFMDQTSSTCQNFYTAGQVSRMRNTLNTLRAQLLTSVGCVVVGISEEEQEGDFSIFPNPVNDILTINSNSPIQKIEIYNSIGQSVYPLNLEKFSFQIELDISNFMDGIYIIQVLSRDKNSMKKFVKN